MADLKISIEDSLKTFLKELSEKTGKPMSQLILYAIEQTFFVEFPEEIKAQIQLKKAEEIAKFIRKLHRLQKTVAFAGKYGKRALMDKRNKAMRELLKAQKLYPEFLPQLQQEIETDLKAHALRELLAKRLKNELEELIDLAVKSFNIDPQELEQEIRITKQFKPELPPEPQRKSIIVRMGVR